MKVGELIEELNRYDHTQEVRLMCTPSWPFEYSVSHVISQSEMMTKRNFDETHDNELEGRRDFDGREVPGDTVFVVEDEQKRYGNMAAWDE